MLLPLSVILDNAAVNKISRMKTSTHLVRPHTACIIFISRSTYNPLLLLIVALVIVYLALVIVALVIIVVALACWLKMDNYAWSSDFELLDVAHFDLVAVECNLR